MSPQKRPAWRAVPTFALAVMLAALCYGCPPDPHVQPNMLCIQGMPFSALCPKAIPNFFDFPWPNNVRRRPFFGSFDPNGALDFTNLRVANEPLLGVALSVIVNNGAGKTNAFGNNSAIFFTLAPPSNASVSPIDESQLPRSEKTLANDSPVMLVNLSPGADYGSRSRSRSTSGAWAPACVRPTP